MKAKIKNSIREALIDLKIDPPTGGEDISIEHPADLSLGDYSSNIAMVLAKKLGKNPRDLATEITEALHNNLATDVEKVEAVGGFINFHLNKYFFQDSVQNILENENWGMNDHFAHQRLMIEYTDPNPFKPFHIGHLMTNAIGESIARIVEYSGGEVKRANYQGDIGLHVARAIYILSKDLKKYVKEEKDVNKAAALIGEAYAEGSKAYESDPEAKLKIDEINKKLYSREDQSINEIYDWGFKLTMEAFEEIYRKLGTKFDFYFLESDVASLGDKIVRNNIGKVFTQSDGAIIFKGEEHDSKLHTRVFITSQGLPTYETKELGLTKAKFDALRDLNLSIVITGKEQAEYMKVVTKAISLIHPETESKMKHFPHGLMRFTTGKMSSREGKVITGESLIKDMEFLAKDKGTEDKKIISQIAIAAIKYSILKQVKKNDIIFDFEKAVSFEGDSGPYLQYSYARARSILEKAGAENLFPNFDNLPPEVTELEKLLYRFPEIVIRSAQEFEPHYIANFLIEIARAYNTLYGNTKIVDTNDPLSPYRLALTQAFSQVLKKGLYLLGIEAPERM